MVYGTRAYPIFDFNAYTSNKRVFHAFNRPVRYPRTGARTGNALKAAYKRFFKRNRRTGAQQVIVVLTDGKSRDGGLSGIARSIKARGVKIFAVGLGRYFNAKELDSFVSKKINEHVFTSDWKQLKHISNDLKKHICLGKLPVNRYYSKFGNTKALIGRCSGMVRKLCKRWYNCTKLVIMHYLTVMETSFVIVL